MDSDCIVRRIKLDIGEVLALVFEFTCVSFLAISKEYKQKISHEQMEDGLQH